MRKTVAAYIVFSVVALLWIVFLPIVVYYINKLWNNRRIDYVAKRRLDLIICFSIWGTCDLLLFKPYTTLITIWYFIPGRDSNLAANPNQAESDLLAMHGALLRFSIGIAWASFVQILVFLVRLWFIYFDYKRNEHLLAWKWRSLLLISEDSADADTDIESDRSNSNAILNPNTHTNTDNHISHQTQSMPWTIKHQHVIGNKKAVVIFAVVLFLGAEISSVLTISYGLTSMQHMLPKYILQFGAFVALFVLCILAISLKDSLGIRREIIDLTRLGFLFGLPWITCALTIPHGYGSEVVSIFLWTALVSCCCMRVLIVIPPHRKASDYFCCVHIANTGGSVTAAAVQLSSVLKLSSGSAKEAAQKPRRLLLGDVLMDDYALNLFAVYLVNEYSFENILYLLEFKQLQLDIMAYADTHAPILTQEQRQTMFALEICSETMGTLCVKHETLPQMLKYARHMHHQFFDAASMSQINVSFTTKRDITNLILKTMHIENETGASAAVAVPDMDMDIHLNLMQEFYIVFESAAQEVYHLLSNDSFGRFCRTKDFTNWRNLSG